MAQNVSCVLCYDSKPKTLSSIFLYTNQLYTVIHCCSIRIVINTALAHPRGMVDHRRVRLHLDFPSLGLLKRCWFLYDACGCRIVSDLTYKIAQRFGLKNASSLRVRNILASCLILIGERDSALLFTRNNDLIAPVWVAVKGSLLIDNAAPSYLLLVQYSPPCSAWNPTS